MGSSRLPGKPLMPFGGTTALEWLLARVHHARTLADVLVATSDHPQDDKLAAECTRLKVACFRGEEVDVLGRLAQTAHRYGAAAIARITADDVLMDPAVVDFMVHRFQSSRVDCATSLTTRSFPNGFVLSVISKAALAKANGLDLDPFEREHVIPAFLARRHLFSVLDVDAPAHWTGYEIGLTLDTPGDYDLLSDVITRAGDRAGGLEQLLDLLAHDPHLRRRAETNGHYWESVPSGTVHRLSRA